MHQITLLAQVVQLLPRDSFKKLVRKYDSDKHSKGISSWDHLVSMVFGHLTGAQSLRDITHGLRSTLGNRSHLGLGHVPSKSSLSYINAKRPWELFKDCYFELYHHLQQDTLPQRTSLKHIRRKLYLLDATVIPLCLSLFDWAQYRTKKGGVKLHTVLDYDGFLPLFCDLTAAKTHEVTVARAQAYPRGSVLVFDRGYTDFSWWKDLDSTGVFFVTRAKDNLDYHIVKSREIPPQDWGITPWKSALWLPKGPVCPSFVWYGFTTRRKIGVFPLSPIRSPGQLRTLPMPTSNAGTLKSSSNSSSNT